MPIYPIKVLPIRK